MLQKTSSVFSRTISLIQAVIYIFTITLFPLTSFAQSASPLPISTIYNPIIIQGMTIHPENPFQLEFIIDPGDAQYKEAELKEESTKLIKYFLTSLTVPEKNMWVNLSPYEKDRIIGKDLQATEMGKDLLELDLQLKQLASSILNPENAVGQEFWKRVHKKVDEKFGNAQMPVNFHNKVWIVPEKAVINIRNNQVFIGESHLKVLHESDYLSIENSLGSVPEQTDTNSVSNQILKEVIIPELEKEVNMGKDFAKLRQIYHSSILAAWYKKNLKESLLSKVYNDQNKTKGVEADNQNYPQEVYNDYLKAFQLGAFDFIKDEYDPATQQVLPKKYFSGGIDATNQQLEAKIGDPDTMMMGRRDFVKNGFLTAAVTLAALCGAGGCGPGDGNGTDMENPEPTPQATPVSRDNLISRSDIFKKTFVSPDSLRSFNFRGANHIATFSQAEVNLFDTSDRENPKLVATINPQGLGNDNRINDISIQNEKLLISTRTNVFIYDLSDGIKNPKQSFQMDLTNRDTIARFIDALPTFEPAGTLDESYKYRFTPFLLENGFAIVNNNDVFSTLPFGTRNGGISVTIGRTAFFAIFDAEGQFLQQDELSHKFPNKKIDMQRILEKRNVVYSVDSFDVITSIIGSMELSGRTEDIEYPNQTLTSVTNNVFEGGNLESSVIDRTERETQGNVRNAVLDKAQKFLYISEDNTSTGSLVRLNLETGATLQVFAVSGRGDNSRSIINDLETAPIENGTRVFSNHTGAISIVDFNDTSDTPTIQLVIALNEKGLARISPTDPEAQNRAQSMTYDPVTDELKITTLDRDLITVNVGTLLERYGGQDVVQLSTIEQDNAMAAFPASDLATNKFTKGGIDLNSANLELTIKGETIHFSIPKELENINPANIQGITPSIINFSPWVPLQSGLKP
jgi:hypothetical protein